VHIQLVELLLEFLEFVFVVGCLIDHKSVLFRLRYTFFPIGTPTKLPHSVHDPS